MYGIKLPPHWMYLYNNVYCYKLTYFRLTDVTSFVREVYQSTIIVKSRSGAYKKAQSNLKLVLKSLFPNDGKLTTMLI